MAISRGRKLANDVSRFIGNNFFIPLRPEDSEDFFETPNFKDNLVFSLLLNYGCFFTFFFIAFLSVKRIITIYVHIIGMTLILLTGMLSHDFVLKSEQSVHGDQYNYTNFITGKLLAVTSAIGMHSDMFKIMLGSNHISADAILHLVIQVILAGCTSYLLSLQWLGRVSLLAFLMPTVATIMHSEKVRPRVLHNIAAYFILISSFLYCLEKINSVFTIIKNFANSMYTFLSRFGLLEAPFQLWNVYKMSAQLLVLWTSIFAMKLYALLSDSGVHRIISGDGSGTLVLIRAISETCSSPLTVLAMCIVVCYLSSAVLTLTKVFLLGMEGFRQDNDLNHGWTEGITLLLVVVQTNMTDMDPFERRHLMVIVLFIIMSTLLESIHDILNPHLLGLAASFNKSVWKHLRAIFLASCLWICPIYMTVFLSRMFTVGFWLMIILSSCLLTTIQVVSSLLIYTIFIYDHLRAAPSDRIDDAIFYIKTVVRCLEFLVALTVVTFGVKEIIYGNWSLVSTLILGVHFYFNVWKRIQAGWESYNMRRAALRKLEVLPEADPTELAALNDVCPICFCEMKSARRTECNHYFHAFCLRKWLYIRDHCPMCQRKINLPANEDEANSATAPDAGQDDADEPYQDYSPSSTDTEVYDDENVDLRVYLDDDFDTRDPSSGEEVSDGGQAGR